MFTPLCRACSLLCVVHVLSSVYVVSQSWRSEDLVVLLLLFLLYFSSGCQSEGAKSRNPTGERPVHPRGLAGRVRRAEGLVQRGIRYCLRHWEVHYGTILLG